MMSRDEIKTKLEGSLTSKRFTHSLNVMKTSVELASKYAVNVEKCAMAGLLHDCARDIKGDELFEQCDKFQISIDEVSKAQPVLLHGPLGAAIAKTSYGITDEHVLKAIRYHTTGREEMTLLEKIVFIADYIEPGRNFPDVTKVRNMAFSDIDKAILMSLERTIMYVMSKGAPIHILTVKARNYIILQHKRR